MGIRDRMAVGAVWMVGFKLLDRSLGLVSTLILARVLVPQDFGVVAMAMSFVALLELATAFGFDVALIQKQTRERGHWDTAWTFNIILGLSVAVAMVAGAAYVADFYRQAELEHVIRALAIGSVVQGFENIGVVAFRTEMRFDREFRFLISKKLVAFAVTIPAALILDSYWALVIGQVTGRATGAAMSYWLHPYRPRLTLAAAGDLLHLSKWLLASNVSDYIRERSPDWIIGRIAGARALGVYNIGAELAALPSTELLAPVNRVVLPAYARLTADRSGLAREYLSVLGVVVLLGIPAVVGIAAVAPLLVMVVLGPRWMDMVPVLTILSFAGVLRIVSGNAFPAYLALRRADIAMKLNFMYGSTAVLMMLILVPRHGIVGAAAATLIANLIGAPVSIGIAISLVGARPIEVLQPIWRPFAAATGMYLGVAAITNTRGIAGSGLANFMSLAIAIAAGIAIYAFLLLMLWTMTGRREGTEAQLLRKAGTIVSRILHAREIPLK
ncbi:MAG: lipopolysaccharide biosynthesis protein [Steroidobacteraceae bacterium]